MVTSCYILITKDIQDVGKIGSGAIGNVYKYIKQRQLERLENNSLEIINQSIGQYFLAILGHTNSIFRFT